MVGRHHRGLADLRRRSLDQRVPLQHRWRATLADRLVPHRPRADDGETPDRHLQESWPRRPVCRSPGGAAGLYVTPPRRGRLAQRAAWEWLRRLGYELIQELEDALSGNSQRAIPLGWVQRAEPHALQCSVSGFVGAADVAGAAVNEFRSLHQPADAATRHAVCFAV